ASEIAKKQIETTGQKQKELSAMRQLVDQALSVVTGSGDIKEFGHLLNETWQLKRSLSSGIAPGYIDSMYESAREAGALGGKILGAGGGGFMLFFADPADHLRIKQSLRDLLY